MDATNVLPTMANEKFSRINEEMSLFRTKYFRKINNNSEIVISEFERHYKIFCVNGKYGIQV